MLTYLHVPQFPWLRGTGPMAYTPTSAAQQLTPVTYMWMTSLYLSADGSLTLAQYGESWRQSF